MHAFSSFLPTYKPKKKAKQAKNPTAQSPFGIRRFDSPSSPHPYANSPPVFHISEYNARSLSSSNGLSRSSTDNDPEDDDSELAGSYSNSRTTAETPRMQLDFDMTAEPLTDWIPAHLLASETPTTSQPPRPLTEPISERANDDILSPNSQLAYDDYDSNEDDEGSELDDDDDDDDDEVSTASEDIVANLKALNATSFVNGGRSTKPDNQNGAYAVTKRPPPTPIKIPNGNVNGPRVQLLRSSVIEDTKSRPVSQTSTDPNSAISGRTIARALIANSFIYTGDKASRYRSGTSVLTRQDSATLPRGEHPLLYSPYGRERTLSTGSEMFSPGSRRDSIIPPVPPVPEAFSPPLVRSPQPAHSDGPLSSDGSSPGPPLPQASSDGDEASPLQGPDGARISRITEVSSAAESPVDSPPPATSIRSLPLPPSPLVTESSFSETRPLSVVTPSEPPSTAPSSGIDFENMLDYYQEAEGSRPPSFPEGVPNYRPIFTPITEESSSQLSPPTPYRRNSASRQGGKLVVIPGSSGSSPGGRIDYARPARNEQGQLRPILLPIGERPRSAQAISPQSTSSGMYNTLYNSDEQSPLVPPPVSTIFSRQRSGSAPSPIKVVRDMNDSNSYNITVTPLPEEASTPSSVSAGDDVGQTFPETPSVFSPTFTTGGSPAVALTPEMDYPPVGPPQLTSSASFSGRARNNLAQQVLLNRAGTSVRHSRQASLGRPRGVAPPLYGPAITEEEEATGLEVTLHRPSSSAIPVDELRHVISQSHEDDDEEVSQTVLISSQDPSNTIPEGTEPSDSPSAYSQHVQHVPPPPPPIPIPSQAPTAGSRSFRSANSSQLSLSSKDKELPDLPPQSATSPTFTTAPHPSQSLPQASTSSHNLVSSPASSSTHSLPKSARSDSRIPPIPAAPTRPPPPPPLFPYSPLTPDATQEVTSGTSEVTARNPGTPPVAVSSPSLSENPPSPVPRPASSASDTSVEPDNPSPFSRTFGSPPPYDTIGYEHVDDPVQPAPTPSTGHSVDRSFVFSPGYPSSPASRDSSRVTVDRQSSLGRRGRMRPPLPAGPRRPSNQYGSGGEHSRRNGSISSTTSMPINLARRAVTSQGPLPSPRFNTPSLKWRGYTMDAAKWTFSSSQLQTIVSRAIRQSAEASSIRLLRLETLDVDIPAEVERLEKERTDVKGKYKLLTRRRAEMLENLAWHATHNRPEDSSAALRIVEELKELTIAQDKLAEDLHSADEQLSQLNSLREVHSASALAMALRKLNASFLKQLGESQELRGQIEALEAERDEAWKQAESLASEYDQIQEKVESASSPSPQSFSRRASRVTASRKSSIRVSKAGLRSARSSVSSHRMSYSTITSGAKSAFSLEDVPPVPPIPRHRPRDIITDFTSRASVGMSTGETPNSETRAMVRAHEELCDMLGISINDTRIRRTRSVIGRPPDFDPTNVMSIYSDVSGRLGSGRPASLPPPSDMAEIQAADRQAMLATLGMISSD